MFQSAELQENAKKTKRELINAHSDLEDKLLIWSVAKYNSFFSCYTELELNYK